MREWIAETPGGVVPCARMANEVLSVRPIIGLEIHVELSTRTKAFAGAMSPAGLEAALADGSLEGGGGANTYIDPVVLGLPGTLPVLCGRAVELSVMVGLALGCEIAELTKWDRKSYFYPDLPKGYQISQYDVPLNGTSVFMLPAVDEQGFPDFGAELAAIKIIRAHLEEDAGKLLHVRGGGGGGVGGEGYTLADYNRAGAALLEIVTAPDFTSAGQAVLFCKVLRQVCRYVGATRGVMQEGHVRFEPNINCELTLAGGERVRTPITEVKNLNSFKAVRAAIDYELAEQPRRYLADGRVMGAGTKVTRGWDDEAERTFVQREKEDAHDYRYFPDPDLPPVAVDAAWREELRARVPVLALARCEHYVRAYGVAVKEAWAATEERGVSDYIDAVAGAALAMGVEASRAGRGALNIILQTGMRLANERGKSVEELVARPELLGALVCLRERGEIGSQGAEPVYVKLAELSRAGGESEGGELSYVREIALAAGVLIVKDAAALEGWADAVIAANAQAAADVRAGKAAAVGRLVGEVMKLGGGKVDAKEVRAVLLKKLGG